MSLDPSQKASAFAASTATFYKVDALKGGTTAMRAARETLLPKHPEEADANYQKRLSTSTLVNYYVKAIDNGVGRAFSKGLQVSNLPSVLSPFLKDIDGSGSTLDQFAQEALWNTIHHGTTYIVADYPRVEQLPVTLADASAQGSRPYLYSIEAPQVLAAYAVSEGGQDRLVHFRWTTTEIEPSEDGLTEQLVQRVKAYTQPSASEAPVLTTWTNDGNDWLSDGGVPIVGVSRIPVVCAYGWKTGFFTGKPVLQDLADLNVAHWQSLSEQTHILSVARVPFLHVSGQNLNTVEAQPDGSTQVKPFKLSVHSAAITPEGTKIEWVETAGASIAAGAENIAYLEEKMAEQSLTLSTSAPGDATATATAINAAEAHSTLKALCVSFEQSMSQALFFLSEFAGSPAPTVAVTFDLEVEVPTATQPAGDKTEVVEDEATA